jgi:hypothetical protein
MEYIFFLIRPLRDEFIPSGYSSVRSHFGTEAFKRENGCDVPNLRLQSWFKIR